MSHKVKEKKSGLSLMLTVVLLLLFLGLFWHIDVDEIWNAITSVPLPLLGGLLVLQVVTQGLLALQWYKITQLFLGKCSFIRIFYILSTGSVIEALTPGAKVGGEVTRLFALKQELGATTEEATHIILLQKSISMSVLLSLCMGSLWYMMKHLQRFFSPVESVLLLLLSGILLLLFLGFLFFSEKLACFLEEKEEKWQKSGKSGKWVKKLADFTRDYAQAVGRLTKGQWLLQFGISMAVWLLFPLKMVILVTGMGHSYHPLFLFAVTMTAYLMGMLPLSPGGLGTFEGAVVGLFALRGLALEESLTIAVLFRFVTFWFVMLGSTFFVISYSKLKNTKKQIKRQENDEK